MLTGYLRTDDFNRDGKPDIAAIIPTHVCGYPPKTCNGKINIFLGNGDGTFSLAFNSSGLYQTLTAGDFDADGNPDLAVVAATNVAYRGDGQGNFNAAGTFSIGQPGDFLLGVDLNGDKLPDLVSTLRAVGRIAVQLNATISDPAFSISVSSFSPAIISRGQSSTASINLQALNASTGAVALTCSVQPSHSAPACSINPSSISFDANGNATATLTINTGEAAVSLLPASLHRDAGLFWFLWLTVAGLVLMGTGFSSRRSTGNRLTSCLLGRILLAGLIFQAACGAESRDPRSTTYTITVTGTSGSTQHSTSIALKLQ
jgi:VCBS repeat protein